MDRISNPPFSTPMSFSPDAMGERASDFYDTAKETILGAGNRAGFTITDLLPGQLAHAAFALGSGIRELNIRSGSLVIADTWTSSEAQDHAIRTIIGPALASQGRAQPDPITSIQLIGCTANPDLSGFNTRGAFASIMIWPDLQADALQLYSEIAERIIGQGQPLLEGSGAHFAYLSHNQVITFEVWRTEQDHRTALHDRIMPQVQEVFGAHSVKGDPTIVSARACGIGVAQEVRYIAAA